MNKTYKEFFDYNDIKIKDKVRISPSGLGNFFNNPQYWYKQNILKDNKFSGNTQTVIGTIIHARIGAYWSNIQYDTDIEVEYLDTYKDNPEVDEWKVADEVNKLWELLQIELVSIPRPDSIEHSIQFEIPNSKYFIGGTYDALRGDTIIDIKTTSTTPKSIKVSHRIQLLTYALTLKMQGINIDKIEVIYLVKTKQPKIVILTEDINDNDYEWIKTEIKNLVKRLELVDNDNSLQDLIFFNNPDSYLS